MTKLVDDVVGVIRHLGYDKCVLVGHGERAPSRNHLPFGSGSMCTCPARCAWQAKLRYSHS